MLFWTSIFAESIVFINEDTKEINISYKLKVFEDKSGLWRLNEVVKLKDKFFANNKDFLDIGFTSSSIWLYFQIQNDSQFTRRMYIVLPSATLDYAELFLKSNQTSKVISQVTGDYLPANKWSNPGFYQPTFIVDLTPKTKKTFYINIKSDSLIRFPIYLHDSESRSLSEYYFLLIHWVIFTIAFIFLVYNIGIFLHNKKIIYLYYIIFILFFYLNAWLVYGTGFKLLWANQPDWHNRTQVLFLSLSLGSALFMIKEFVNFKNPMSDIKNYIFVFLGICLICLSILSLMGIKVVYRVYVFNALYFGSIFYSMYLLFQTWKMRKELDALFIFLGTLSLGSLGFLHSFLSLNLLPYTSFTTYSNILISPVVLILVSYGLFHYSQTANKGFLRSEERKGFYDQSMKLNTELEPRPRPKLKLNQEQEQKLKEKILFLLEEQKLYKQEHLNLESFSGYLSMDSRVLEAFFEKHYNLEFDDYLRKLRIEKAKFLLEISNIRIEALGSEVGFLDASYFIELFKNITGLSPTEYRKKLRKGKE
jgi:AraC-like DNA-binding protein